MKYFISVLRADTQKVTGGDGRGFYLEGEPECLLYEKSFDSKEEMEDSVGQLVQRWCHLKGITIFIQKCEGEE